MTPPFFTAEDFVLSNQSLNPGLSVGYILAERANAKLQGKVVVDKVEWESFQRYRVGKDTSVYIHSLEAELELLRRYKATFDTLSAEHDALEKENEELRALKAEVDAAPTYYRNSKTDVWFPNHTTVVNGEYVEYSAKLVEIRKIGEEEK